MSTKNAKPKNTGDLDDIGEFEQDIKCELETVEEIALSLFRYRGRVRARILAYVKELLEYRESGA